MLGGLHRLWDRVDEGLVPGGEPLVDQGGIAADEVDAHLLGGPLQGQSVTYRIPAGGGSQHGDGGHRDPLVDDGDAVFRLQLFAGAHQVLGAADDLLVDLLAGALDLPVRAVQQGDAHGDGTDVQVFVLDHPDGF